MKATTKNIYDLVSDINNFENRRQWVFIDKKSEHNDWEVLLRIGTKKNGVVWVRNEFLTGKTQKELLNKLDELLDNHLKNNNYYIADTIKEMEGK